MGWIKKIFCRHTMVKFERNIYGDEINHAGGRRSLWRCERCDGLVARWYLGPHDV